MSEPIGSSLKETSTRVESVQPLAGLLHGLINQA